MSLSKINILYDNYKAKEKIKNENNSSFTPEKKATEITKKDTNDKSGSGIFQMINKEPKKQMKNEKSKKKDVIRKDYKGTVIQKGNKSHKVSFIDQVGRNNLIDEVQVESYKQFNFDLNNMNENCACKCLVI